MEKQQISRRELKPILLPPRLLLSTRLAPDYRKDNPASHKPICTVEHDLGARVLKRVIKGNRGIQFAKKGNWGTLGGGGGGHSGDQLGNEWSPEW